MWSLSQACIIVFIFIISIIIIFSSITIIIIVIIIINLLDKLVYRVNVVILVFNFMYVLVF